MTLYHDAVNLVGGHHLGTDLHLPWVAVSVVMVVVVFRRLPVSYGLYSAAIVVVAASGSNLDSFERYALGAFPLVLAGATLLRSRRVEITVLVLSAVTMFAYALLAFLVPTYPEPVPGGRPVAGRADETSEGTSRWCSGEGGI